MIFTIYHNPRCSKSRNTLKILEESGVDVMEVRYLESVPDKATLKHLIHLLGVNVRDIVRNSEAIYKELSLDQVRDDETLLDAMVSHPILIERPIVVAGSRAIIGRPPEKVLDLLD
ncbi:MAG: arsenate reductase [marine bacterium B5-7]|nr:MAG: arsenate reductase [marine bacterium B5-7]